MSQDGVARPRYSERQHLTAADLEAEQAHRLALRRRHAAALHGWGVVSGLELDHRPGVGLEVARGAAVDGYGREIVLAEPFLLDAATLEGFLADVGGPIAVWLLYGREPATPLRRGRQPCGPGRHGRWRGESRLRLTAAVGVDPRCPPGVEAFDPHRLPPDDPAVEWPVYLGRVELGTAGGHSVDLSGRPHAALTGDLVRDPRDRVRVRLARAPEHERFVVSLADDGGDHRERLAVDRDGATVVRADAAVEAGVTLEATAAAPSQGVGLGQLAETPVEAAPWAFYRTAPEGGNEQLRIEIGHPGDEGDPANFRLVIGRREAAGFTPYLSVGADCTLTVHGKLDLSGQLVEAPRAADPSDPRFALEAATAWTQGIGAALDQTGSLALSFELESAEVSQPIEFGVRVHNTGAVTLVSVRVFASASHLSGASLEVGFIATLEPGASGTLYGQFEGAGPGTVTLVAVASAVAAGKWVTTASVQADVALEEVPIP